MAFVRPFLLLREKILRQRWRNSRNITKQTGTMAHLWESRWTRRNVEEVSCLRGVDWSLTDVLRCHSCQQKRHVKVWLCLLWLSAFLVQVCDVSHLFIFLNFTPASNCVVVIILWMDEPSVTDVVWKLLVSTIYWTNLSMQEAQSDPERLMSNRGW